VARPICTAPVALRYLDLSFWVLRIRRRFRGLGRRFLLWFQYFWTRIFDSFVFPSNRLVSHPGKYAVNYIAYAYPAQTREPREQLAI
jgi:hypothetical protein